MSSKTSRNNSNESFNDSITSLKSINPPWCSGKLTTRRKLSPNWEIQSSYPLRENIWEYLHNGENLKCRSKRLNRKTNKPEKCHGRKTKLTLFILCVMGLMGSLSKLYPTQSSKVFDKSITKTMLLKESLLKFIGWENTQVNEECCQNIKHLVQELSRKERILRNALRLKTLTVKEPYVPDTIIKDLTAAGDSDTQELYSRSVTLWGWGPLWRAAPSPNIVLSMVEPQPADCWAFRGSTGKLHIYLPFEQEVKSISVEHVSPDAAKSAPRHFELYGVIYDDTVIPLLNGQYRNDGPTKQFFHIKRPALVKEVVFFVMSNYGNEKYTCIYRVHLYGDEDNSIHHHGRRHG